MPTIKEKRAACRQKKLVYDLKLKKCRQSKRRSRKAVKSKPSVKVVKASSAKPVHVSDKCPQNKILNPKTKRCVLKTGKIGRKLMAKHTSKKSAPKSVPKPVRKSVRKPVRKSVRKPVRKPVRRPKPSTNKGGNLGRQGLCPIPSGYTWAGRLGATGKDGETWKVIGPDGKRYACKIFDSKKSEKLIQKEIGDQKKMGDSGVSPRVVWQSNKCFLMEMINGPVLYDKNITAYTQKDVNELSDIAHALADAKIGYNDPNVKMNVMYDNDKDRWMIIDFGMLLSEKNVKKFAKKNKLSLEKQYLLLGFNIMLYVEVIFMSRIYGAANLPYTPYRGGFLPKPGFPSLLHEINKLGLLEKAGTFKMFKEMRERQGKYYDKSKMIGV